MTNMMNANENMVLSVLSYNGSKVAFEIINGKVMVNATQMAKPFGKRPVEWLRFQQSKDLIATIAKVGNHTSADLQIVKKGGLNQGTWLQEDVALFFAQWLSPEFYLACNTKLKDILKKETLNIPSKFGVNGTAHEGKVVYPYTEILRSLGASTKGSSAGRKTKHPQHFFKLFGRNFITGAYAELLKGYYNYKFNQLKLEL